MKGKISSYKELDVFNESFNLALEIFRLTKGFPFDEKYSLTDQIRRSSRSVSLNIGEAWRKRRYPKSFIAKLSDSETEACGNSDITSFCQRIWIHYIESV
jgi:four helix bundle protein